MLVSAAYQAKLCEIANQLVRFRPKELASLGGGEFDRVDHGWSFQAHTSPMCGTIVVRAIMGRTLGNLGPSASVFFEDANDTTKYLFGTTSGGYAPGQTNDGVPDEWSIQTLFLDARAFQNKTLNCYIKTDYSGGSGDLSSVTAAGGNLIACAVYEYAAPADTDYGYLPQSYGVGQGIYEDHRKGLVEMAIAQWKRGGAHIFNWTAMDGFPYNGTRTPTNSTTTYTNILDDSSSSSTESVGFWIDLRNCNRKGNSFVPARLAAFVNTTGGNTAVRIVDSTGASIRTMPFSGATFGWQTGDVFFLPPTLQKIDIMHRGDSGPQTIRTYAVSLYQYEA